MSTNATSAGGTAASTKTDASNASPSVKGKGKAVHPTEAMNEDDDGGDDDDEEEDEEEEDDDDDDEEEESFEEIDPSAIISGGRRTRGARVDYTSAEALAKAGLKPETDDDEEDKDKDAEMKDN